MEDMYIKIGGALVLLLTNLALFFKSKADINSVKNDRLQTKETRDKDSQALHDEVLELRFKYTALKDAQQLQSEQIADAAKQVGVLNTQLAQVLVKLDNVIETLKELKAESKSLLCSSSPLGSMRAGGFSIQITGGDNGW